MASNGRIRSGRYIGKVLERSKPSKTLVMIAQSIPKKLEYIQ
jgi:hypothetical protein